MLLFLKKKNIKNRTLLHADTTSLLEVTKVWGVKCRKWRKWREWRKQAQLPNYLDSKYHPWCHLFFDSGYNISTYFEEWKGGGHCFLPIAFCSPKDPWIFMKFHIQNWKGEEATKVDKRPSLVRALAGQGMQIPIFLNRIIPVVKSMNGLRLVGLNS